MDHRIAITAARGISPARCESNSYIGSVLFRIRRRCIRRHAEMYKHCENDAIRQMSLSSATSTASLTRNWTALSKNIITSPMSRSSVSVQDRNCLVSTLFCFFVFLLWATISMIKIHRHVALIDNGIQTYTTVHAVTTTKHFA
jgi:hypothetical protein